MFGTKLKDALSNKEKVMIHAMNESIVEFNRTVFNEDKVICEQVQKGIIATSKSGILSKEEERVLSFHEAYNQYMKIN